MKVSCLPYWVSRKFIRLEPFLSKLNLSAEEHVGIGHKSNVPIKSGAEIPDDMSLSE